MLRLCAGWFCLFLVTAAVAQNELPGEPADSFEIEPPSLIPDTAEGSEPEPAVLKAPEQIAAALERAKKRAAASERFVRGGLISKVEAEERALEVVRLEADLAAAQSTRATADLAALQARLEAGELVASELERAKADSEQKKAAAEETAARRDAAELEAAVRNLKRQQKLHALGSARQSDVTRAAEKVAALEQSKKARALSIENPSAKSN